MYNFNLDSNEELKEIFEDVHIKQGENEKIITVALTSKRLLFLDYINDEANEVLRVSRGVGYVKYKEVFYEVNVDDVKVNQEEGKLFMILNDLSTFEFDNYRLYEKLNHNEHL